MEADILKIAGQIAGVAGLALAVFLLTCREVIRKNVFTRLSKEHSYALLRMTLWAAWSVAVLGIAAWSYGYAVDRRLLQPRTSELNDVGGALAGYRLQVEQVRKVDESLSLGVESIATYEDLRRALDRVKEYSRITSGMFDSSGFYRLIKERGDGQLHAKYVEVMNAYSFAMRDLSRFLVDTINSGRAGSQKALEERYDKYVQALNEASTAQAEYHGFVLSLVPADFRN